MNSEVNIGTPLVQPVLMERAFEHPERITDLIRENAPYWWVMRNAGSAYVTPEGIKRHAWFRGEWFAAEPERGDRDILLFDPSFISGSLQAFGGFEIVRPNLVILNLMAPSNRSQPAHFDAPRFRGFGRDDLRGGLGMIMARSKLFERWAVNISSALTWLYKGAGGGLAYWPEGPDKAPCVVQPPLDNRGLISDNQRMYHAVLPIGEAPRPLDFPDDALLECGPASSWIITDAGEEIARFEADEIRISILWKALMFRNAEEEEIYDQHLDDLTLDMIYRILTDEARRRGHVIPGYATPLSDPDFLSRMNAAFPWDTVQGDPGAVEKAA
jgi:hypothetical protein